MSSKTTKNRPRRRSRSPFITFTLLGALVTALLVLALREYTGLTILLAYLAAVNLTTFGLYGYDKTIAGWNTLRVPEKTLHLFEFIGGTPFAFLAQRVFRHKTVKLRYRVVFWTLAVIQAALIVWGIWYWKSGGGS